MTFVDCVVFSFVSHKQNLCLLCFHDKLLFCFFCQYQALSEDFIHRSALIPQPLLHMLIGVLKLSEQDGIDYQVKHGRLGYCNYVQFLPIIITATLHSMKFY